VPDLFSLDDLTIRIPSQRENDPTITEEPDGEEE
tara:strand:- start:3991 stop:4092 length:102 start_codon:yes stop_codon:yes gene_type:complete